MPVTACESDCTPAFLHSVDEAMVSAREVIPGQLFRDSEIPPCFYSVQIQLWKYVLL